MIECPKGPAQSSECRWYSLIPVESKMLGCRPCILVPTETRPHERYLDSGPDSGSDFDLGNATAQPGPRERYLDSGYESGSDFDLGNSSAPPKTRDVGLAHLQRYVPSWLPCRQPPWL